MTTLTPENVCRMTTIELRNALEERNLPIQGLKGVLLTRLIEAIAPKYTYNDCNSYRIVKNGEDFFRALIIISAYNKCCLLWSDEKSPEERIDSTPFVVTNCDLCGNRGELCVVIDWKSICEICTRVADQNMYGGGGDCNCKPRCYNLRSFLSRNYCPERDYILVMNAKACNDE